MTDAFLFFDGYRLYAHDASGTILRSWQAYSGTVDFNHPRYQPMANAGPTPEGVYVIDYSIGQNWDDLSAYQKSLAMAGMGTWPGGTASWGNHRIQLGFLPGDTHYGRSGFFIHGGDAPGSIGCIDLVGGMDDFYQWMSQQSGPVSLRVDYSLYANGAAELASISPSPLIEGDYRNATARAIVEVEAPLTPTTLNPNGVELASSAVIGERTDYFYNVATLRLTGFDDEVNFDPVVPTWLQAVNGEGGDDTFNVFAKLPSIDGGAGVNTLSFHRYIPLQPQNPYGVTFDLLNPAAREPGGSSPSVINIQNVTGSGYADLISGDSGRNVLKGGAGTDTLYGRGGDDDLYGGSHLNNLFGGAGQDKLYGEDGWGNLHGEDDDDVLYAGSGAGESHLYGGKGNDTLHGGSSITRFYADEGNDTFFMGSGTNYLSYAASPDAIVADLHAGTVTGGYATGDTIVGSFRNVTGTSKADTFILGSAGSMIWGGEGLDTYVMGSGADKILDGTAFQHNGQGAIIDYRGSSAGITLKYTSPSIGFVGTTGWATGDEIMVSQQVTIHGTEQIDHIVGRGWSQAWMYSNGDETVFGYGGADIIDLRSGNNYVDGGEGNDTITTAEGNDIVLGGDGDDVISVGLGSDVVYAEAGMDTILTLADSQVDLFDLGADGGHLSYSGSLPGVFGNGVSIDLLTGTYQFRVNDTAAWQALNDTIVGPILSLTGSQNADALTGTNEADIIKGGKGRDVILGMGGNDKLFAPFAILVDGGEGNDDIDFGTGFHPWYAPPLTTVIGGTGEDFIFGNGGTVDIYGGNDNDTIQTWKDLAPGESFQSTFGTIRGGTGVDTIRITNGFTVFAMGDGDSITGKTPGQLNSTVNYSEALSGVTINGVTGQGSDYIPYMNHIVGSNFADVIYLGTRHSWAGASGTMNGGGGDDTFYGVNGSVFNQSIHGGSGNDVFYGGSAGSVFYGGVDNDAMYSGTGKDVFHMGDGNDVFYYGVEGGIIGGQDIIHGFVSGQDKLFMPASMLVRRDVNDRDDDGDLNETFIQTKEEWFEEFNGNAHFRTAAGNPDMSNYVRIEGVPKTSLSVDDFQFI
jgi:Ca2+-binding RTX toxin-like protein